MKYPIPSLRALLAPALLTLWILPGSAQTLPEASVAYPIQMVEPGARAAGMGDCFTAVADDLSALFSNCAGLSFLPGVQLALMHNGDIGQGFTETFAAALPLKGIGNLAFAGQMTDYGSFDRRDALGNLQGSFTPLDLGLRAGFGFTLSEGVRLGLASHWIRQEVDGWVSSGLSWDAGVLLVPDKGFRLGAALNNLGLETGRGNQPTELSVGAAFRAVLDPGKEENYLWVAGSGGYGFQGLGRLGLGLEFTLERSYCLRVGFSRRFAEDPQEGVLGLGLGAGIRMGEFQMDYSITFQGELGNLHRIALSLALPGEEGSKTLPPRGSSLPPGEATDAGGKKKTPVFMKFQVSTGGDQTAQQLFELGQQKWRMGLKQDAMDYFLQALDKDPDLDAAWEALGRLYLDKSLEAYRKLLEKHPENERLRQWLEGHGKK